MRAACLLLCLTLLLLTQRESRAQVPDAGDWQAFNFVSLNYVDTPRFDLYAIDQWRLREGMQETGLFSLSHRAYYHALPWLDLGLNYTWLDARALDGETYIETHRPEFEINPKWHAWGLDWDLRNRYELRYIEGAESVRPRFRHRLQASHELKNCGILKGLIFSDEVFYDTTMGKVSENRLLPCSLVLHLGPKADLVTGYGLRSLRVADHWLHHHYVMSTLLLRF
jgi:Protein of unknown function (DUF2490)